MSPSASNPSDLPLGLEPLSYTVAQTCRILNIGRTTFYDLVKAGHLEVFKIGRGTRATAESVRRVATEGTRTRGPDFTDNRGLGDAA